MRACPVEFDDNASCFGMAYFNSSNEFLANGRIVVFSATDGTMRTQPVQTYLRLRSSSTFELQRTVSES